MSNIPTTGNLDIIIQMPETTGGDKGETVGGEAPSPATPQVESPVTTSPDIKDKNQQSKQAVAVGVAMNLGSKAVTTAVSNIGLATGNYYAQRQAQSAMNLANTAISLAMSASNPVTLAVTIGSMAISTGAQIYADYKQRQYDNFVANQNARRLGLSEGRR